jgi:hypothetical protein
MLLVEAANHTRSHKLDEMARILKGKGFSKMTSYCNLACLMGFAMSFIVYQKESIPLIVMSFAKKESLPIFLTDGFLGEVFYGTLYTVRIF